MAKVNIPNLPDSIPVIGSHYVSFIVNCDGAISEVCPVKLKTHPTAIALVEHIKQMPDWIPGKNKGKPIRVRYTLPLGVI